MTANESVSGGKNYFAIEDITGSKKPFMVTAGAPNNSLYVSQNGNIGMQTSTPVLPLHIFNGNTPGVRLHQEGGGWGTYV